MSNQPRTSNDYQSVDDALGDLCAGFIDHPKLCRYCELVEPNHVSSPFYELLVHEDHMTTRLSSYYGCELALRVLDATLDGEQYRRRIVLTTKGRDQDKIVEFGLVRIDLRYTPPEVRAAILERKTPLGEILIRHDVLRRIEPRWFLQLAPECALLQDIRAQLDGEVYGRIGTIHCNGAAAIELLEIVTGARMENGE
jgi:hypothetical protein